MKQFCSVAFFLLYSVLSFAQSFTRTELPGEYTKPWEIIYGPDDFLWLSEDGAQVFRVDPSTGEKQLVYVAPDYFGESPLEESELCPGLKIGKGTLGLALDPDFLNPENAYIYFVYSYNSGTDIDPATKFRIKRLTWDAINNEVVGDSNIVNNLSTGYDHLGGRLMAIKQGGEPYLILTTGDNGRSELSGDCYDPPSSNPNNFAQDVDYLNGKVHRFNMDGSIPIDNPISNNSFYTRGHRNPQGLSYNPTTETLYCIEHGDDTDDEINILYKGMNYGWKNVRGYNDDDNLEGELEYVNNYEAHPLIPNDALIEPIYSWCTTPATSTNGSNWCTVAPSDGIYYGSDAIEEWENSLLVVTLKEGVTTDKEVYQFKLQDDGQLEPSTVDNPNPKKFFAEDQDLNGRLRDIAVSPDGKVVYLINNNGPGNSKITVYNYIEPSSVDEEQIIKLSLYPNPASDEIRIQGLEDFSSVSFVQVRSTLGQSIGLMSIDNGVIDVSNLNKGIHFLEINYEKENYVLKFIKN